MYSNIAYLVFTMLAVVSLLAFVLKPIQGFVGNLAGGKQTVIGGMFEEIYKEGWKWDKTDEADAFLIIFVCTLIFIFFLLISLILALIWPISIVLFILYLLILKKIKK